MANSTNLRPPSETPTSKRTWVLYLFLGLFAAMLLTRPTQPGNRLSYSEFKQKLANGQVSEVEVSKERLKAVPADDAAKKRGERWIVQRVDDPNLVKDLEAKQVAFSGVQEGDWLSSLFMVWILPM